MPRPNGKLGISQAICRIVLDASGPITTTEVARELVRRGGEAKNVSQAMFALREAGVVERATNAEGQRAYIAGDAAELRERAGVADVAEPATSPRPERRATSKRRGRPRSAPAAPAPAVDEPPLFNYAVSERGDLQIARADGEGEAAVIRRSEVLRLYAFIEMAMPIIRKARPEMGEAVPA